MKQNGFKSRWLIGPALPHCSGENKQILWKGKLPKFNKKIPKRLLLTGVKMQETKEEEKPFKVETLTIVAV